MAISMLKIRRPLGRLIFNMGIAIPGKTVFLIETAPWFCGREIHRLLVNSLSFRDVISIEKIKDFNLAYMKDLFSVPLFGYDKALFFL